MSETAQAPAGISGTLAALRAAVAELARQDWASLPTAVQDEAIRVLEEADAGQAAIRGAALAAFGDGPGCSWYGHQRLTAYLAAETRVTRAAARAHQAWATRHRQHPVVMAALADMALTVSVAVKICAWSDQLPAEHRTAADEILLTAWLGGCTMGDLAMLATQMREELLDPDDGKEPEPGITLDTTTDGAGVLHGDLAPSVSALVRAAFAQYGARRGPDDDRSLARRQHDALGEICRQVLALCGRPASGSEPSDGGAPGDGGTRPGRGLTALVLINLAHLLDLRGAGDLERAWITSAAAQWAGEIARLHQLLQAERSGVAADPRLKHGLAADLLGWAIKTVSGPGGFASFARTRLLAGTVLGSGSLVLDVGRTREIPRQLRIAVALRDRRCAKPGCDRPASATEPHHVIHYADGGLTNPGNLKAYCYAHHHILLHEQGWNGHMHPDGTVDLYRPDGTRYTPGVRYLPEPDAQPP